MANLKDIRRRIRSVTNIQQITKAMKMVAAARLQKAQERALGSKQYTERLREILMNLSAQAGEFSHPLMETPKRGEGRTAYILMSADKGLAGAYSGNAIKALLPLVKDSSQADIIAVGRKGRDYFARREYSIVKEHLGISERPSNQDAIDIAKEVAELFLSGTYKEVHLVFTQFFSPAHHVPEVVQLLPIQPETAKKSDVTYIFEPGEQAVIDWLIPRYMENIVYAALIQSAASELGARMTAMSSATDNAKELISDLTLTYNKVRQANITREITEIVGGAEALR